MKAMESARNQYSGRKVGIIGLGREGLALSRFFLSIGAKVVISDDKKEAAIPVAANLARAGVELLLGGLSPAVFTADYCFISPGVPLDNPVIAQGIAEGRAKISNETDLLLSLCPSTVAGITGSSGKSTTTALVAKAAGGMGKQVFLGGNIGVPIIERLDEMTAEDYVVLEMSSFQLDLARRSPQFAAITNITPNHLDRHHTMAAYARAKSNICRWQNSQNTTVLNYEDDLCRDMALLCPGRVLWFSNRQKVPHGAYLEDGQVMVTDGTYKEAICRVEEIKLLGWHNVSNVLTASALAWSMGIPLASIRETMITFTGLPHRIELIGVVNGVSYCNHSIATTPERSITGMRSMHQPFVLLAGGRSKHLPWDVWADEVEKRAFAVILFGECQEEIARALQGKNICVSKVKTMTEAVAMSHEIAQPGQAVLLSPGGTSFDEFPDFEARGDSFRKLVKELES